MKYEEIKKNKRLTAFKETKEAVISLANPPTPSLPMEKKTKQKGLYLWQ